MRKFLILLALVPMLTAGDCSGGDQPRRQTDGHYPPSGPVAPVPEPTAALLFGAGLILIGVKMRSKR